MKTLGKQIEFLIGGRPTRSPPDQSLAVQQVDIPTVVLSQELVGGRLYAVSLLVMSRDFLKAGVSPNKYR